MTIEEVMDYFEGGRSFHYLTGLSEISYRNWVKAGYVPIVSQMKLERITDGALKCDVNDIPKEAIEKGYYRKMISRKQS